MSDSERTQWLTDSEQRSWRALLFGMSRLHERLNANMMADHGITGDDYEVLSMLSEADDLRMRMAELAERRVASRSRLTHHVTRLENAGLVERVACDDDRRGTWAHLTSAGVAMIQRAAPDHVKTAREFLVDTMSPAEFANLGQAMERALATLNPADIDRLP